MGFLSLSLSLSLSLFHCEKVLNDMEAFSLTPVGDF